MVRKNSDGQSAESIARANRQRVAQEDGARAMAGIEQKAIAVRKNMERLRALRETRETQEAILEQSQQTWLVPVTFSRCVLAMVGFWFDPAKPKLVSIWRGLPV